MKRIPVYRDGEMTMIKPQDEQRFLERGWQTAQPKNPKKVSNRVKVDVKVQADADIIKAVEVQEEKNDFGVWEAPIVSFPNQDKPTDNQ